MTLEWLRKCGTFFAPAHLRHHGWSWGVIPLLGQGLMKDKKTMNDMSSISRRRDDGLGPNSDIGNKLRALYGAVQEEGIPSTLLDLLEQLDKAEQQAGAKGSSADDR